jgi:hypothetical protein
MVPKPLFNKSEVDKSKLEGENHSYEEMMSPLGKLSFSGPAPSLLSGSLTLSVSVRINTVFGTIDE